MYENIRPMNPPRRIPDWKTIQIINIRPDQYPDFVDAEAVYGYWKDGTQMSDSELFDLKSHPEFIDVVNLRNANKQAR